LGLGDTVRFEGFVDEDGLRSLYRSAQSTIVPSLYEPFGLVTLEAMASGTPVVASDTGGTREIVEHEVSGLLFPPGDAGGLAEAVLRVLRDRDFGDRLASEARSILATRGSWSSAASRTAESYQRAIDAAASGRRPRLRVVTERGV
jgi:glycogen(starch) synthase